MGKFIITNAKIINEGEIFSGSLVVEDEFFLEIFSNQKDIAFFQLNYPSFEIIDIEGKYLIPGVIDDQVHFREPGLTHKGDIYTESKAAVAGGITSFMEMPNTIPNTLTQELLEEKYQLASEKSLANFSFYMGASNDNIEEILKTNPLNVCGVKVFMGASTGNMLVDKEETLDAIFSKSKMLIATHCEDENTIKENVELYRKKYGEDVPIEAHPIIRSREACYKSSSFAVKLAKKHNTRLHILHLSTYNELDLFDNNIPLAEKQITSEVCVHHLWFSDKDYEKEGTFIKWNPSIKSEKDRDALREAVNMNLIDVIATDHAPHTLEEKQNQYFKAPSGGPLVQHSLVAMFELVKKGVFTLGKIVEKMSHNPAILFKIDKRGFIKKGYYADFVILESNEEWVVDKSNILYKCGWSPFENQKFHTKITHTFINGNLVYQNGTFFEGIKGKRLLFNR